MKYIAPLFATALLTLALPAAAVTFHERADFLAAGGTYTDHTSISPDFTVSNGPGGSFILESDTTTYTDIFGGNEFVIVSGEENFNLDVTFTTSIFAFGMDIYEPTASQEFNGCNVTPCVESTFAISFLSGATLLDTVTIEPANDTLDFIGFSSAIAFDRIEVRETVGNNDNEMFGNLVTSTTALAPIPLPASGLLLLAGVSALWLRRRT